MQFKENTSKMVWERSTKIRRICWQKEGEVGKQKYMAKGNKNENKVRNKGISAE